MHGFSGGVALALLVVHVGENEDENDDDRNAEVGCCAVHVLSVLCLPCAVPFRINFR